MNELGKKRSLVEAFMLIAKENIIENTFYVWLCLLIILLVRAFINKDDKLLLNTITFLIVVPLILIVVVSIFQWITESLKELYRRCEIISTLPITEDEIKELNIQNCTDYIMFLMCYRAYRGKYNNFTIAELPESMIDTIEDETKKMFKDTYTQKLLEHISIIADRDYIVKNYMSGFLYVNKPTDSCIELCQKILDSRRIKLSIRDIMNEIKSGEYKYAEYLEGQDVL